jgi:hypothetical protein
VNIGAAGGWWAWGSRGRCPAVGLWGLCLRGSGRGAVDVSPAAAPGGRRSWGAAVVVSVPAVCRGGRFGRALMPPRGVRCGVCGVCRLSGGLAGCGRVSCVDGLVGCTAVGGRWRTGFFLWPGRGFGRLSLCGCPGCGDQLVRVVGLGLWPAVDRRLRRAKRPGGGLLVAAAAAGGWLACAGGVRAAARAVREAADAAFVLFTGEYG